MASHKTILALITATAALAGTAEAAEVFATANTRGDVDVRAAELPPEPGFYVGTGLVYFNSRSLRGANGDEVFPDTKQDVAVPGVGLLYVMPDEFLGGRVGFSAQFAYGRNDTTVTNLPAGPGGTSILGDNYGFFDPVVGVRWSKGDYNMENAPEMGPPPGFIYSLSLDMTLPIGAYESGRVANPGFDAFVLTPNVAMTYRTAPLLLDGTELSASLSYSRVFERDAGNTGLPYKDGDFITADFALTERYKMFQFGLAGTYVDQVQDDQSDVPGTANGRFETLSLGAVLAIDFSPTSGVKFKYLQDVHAENAFKDRRFSFGVYRKF
jgi:hypothetical protein